MLCDRKTIKYQLSLMNLRVMRCITVNVLQTKVDAQCDKLGQKCSQCLQQLTFTSYSELFVESQF